MTLLDALKIDNPTLTSDTSFYFKDNEENENTIYFCYYECFKREFMITRLNSEKDFTTYPTPWIHLKYQHAYFFNNIKIVNIEIKVLDNI